MSSFRRFGGINYSANNNIVRNHISNADQSNINNYSGQANSKEVFASHLDMSGNSLLHLGTIYFQDGSSMNTATVTGPIGPTGPTGFKGADSFVTGPTGYTGPTGDKSTVTGPTGYTGPASSVTGPTGDKSDVTGPTGERSTITGYTGPTGDKSDVTGPTGHTGPPSLVTGPTGDKSDVTGPTGERSTITGYTGPTGDKSDVTGPTGPPSLVTGPTGASSFVTGPTGASSFVTGPTGAPSFVAGPTGPSSTITGPTGPPGTQPWVYLNPTEISYNGDVTINSGYLSVGGNIYTSGYSSFYNGNLVVNGGAIYVNKNLNMYATASLYLDSPAGGNGVTSVYREQSTKNLFIDSSYYDIGIGGGVVFRLKNPTGPSGNYIDSLNVQPTYINCSVPLTSTATIPSINENSTVIPTTSWVQQVINSKTTFTGPTGADSFVTGPTGASSFVTGPTGAPSFITGPTGASSFVTGPTGASSFVTGPTGAPSFVTGPTGYTGHTGAPSFVTGPTGASSFVTGPTGTQPWGIGSSGKIYYNGGNVGIGTTGPTYLLSLGNLNQNCKLALYDDGTGNNWYGIGANNNNLTFGAGLQSTSNLQMVLSNAGFLGIGTTVPQYMLDVNGTSRVNGVATFNNDIVQSNSESNNITQQTITTLSNPNILRTTNLYGSLSIYNPTGQSGGDLRLWEVGGNGNSSQLYTSGSQLNIINLTSNGYISFTNTNGSGIQTQPLRINSDNMTIQTTNPPTQTAVQPASTDSSNNIPTTAWVQSAISSGNSNILNSNNNWTGNNTFTSSNSITINTPINVNNFYQPTSINQIGYTNVYTVENYTLTVGTNNNIYTFTNVSPGIYLFFVCGYMESNATVSGQHWIMYFNNSAGTTLATTYIIPGSVPNTYIGSANMSCVLINNSTQNYTFRTFTSSNTISPEFTGSCSLTRIA